MIDGEVVPEHIRRSEDIYEMGPDHPLHYMVMSCFENVPEDRPSAAELVHLLGSFKPEGDRVDIPSMNRSKLSLASSASSSRFDGEFDKQIGSLPSYASVMKLTKNRHV